MRESEKIEFDPQRIQDHARQFDTSVFRQKMWETIAEEIPAEKIAAMWPKGIANAPLRASHDLRQVPALRP